MQNRFSEQRLANIRRLRKARRLYKQVPLFAYELMKSQYADYSWPAFMEDLRLRSKPKQKQSRSPLKRFGRYYKMQELLSLYAVTQNTDLALQAITLRNNMTRPYRLLVQVEKQAMVFTFPATVPYSAMQGLSQSCQRCKTMAEATQLIENFRSAMTML